MFGMTQPKTGFRVASGRQGEAATCAKSGRRQKSEMPGLLVPEIRPRRSLYRGGPAETGSETGEEMLFTFALISSFAFAHQMVRRVPLTLPLRELWCNRFAKGEEDLPCRRRDYRLPPSTCCGPCLWLPEDVRLPHPSFVIAGSLVVAKASSCPLLPGDPKRR